MNYTKIELKKLGSLTLALAGFYYVFSRISINETVQVLKNSDPLFFGGSAAVLAIIYYVMGWRWKTLLEEKNVNISSTESFRNICLSNFFNTFLPARGGDIYRGYLSSGDEKNTLDMSVIVLMERVTDVLVLFILLGVTVVSFYPSGGLLKYLSVAGMFLITGLLGLKFVREVENLPFQKLDGLYPRFRKYIVENFYTEKIFRLLTLTLFIWLFGILRTQLVVSGLNISLELGAIAVITFSWALISALPLTPSGFGTTDAALFTILTVYGVSSSDTAAFILMNRLILQGFPLAAGGLHYTLKTIF